MKTALPRTRSCGGGAGQRHRYGVHHCAAASPRRGPMPRPGSGSSPLLPSAFTMATRFHFTCNKATQPQAIWGFVPERELEVTAGRGCGLATQGEERSFDKTRSEVKGPLLFSRGRKAAQLGPPSFTFAEAGTSRMPREKSQNLFIPPPLAPCTYSISHRSCPSSSRVRGECDGHPAGTSFLMSAGCLSEAGLAHIPTETGQR